MKWGWRVPGLGLEVQLGWVELLLLQKLPSSFCCRG